MNNHQQGLRESLACRPFYLVMNFNALYNFNTLSIVVSVRFVYRHKNKPPSFWISIVSCTCPVLPGARREIDGVLTHIYVIREMGAAFYDTYMRHRAKMNSKMSTSRLSSEHRPGARSTKHISENSKHSSAIYVADHNDTLHTSRQCHCRDVCKISLWSVECIRN